MQLDSRPVVVVSRQVVRYLSIDFGVPWRLMWTAPSHRYFERISQKIMQHNDFAGWVREQIDSGPYRDDVDAARKLGVPPSTVARWLSVRHPTRSTIRKVATVFGVPIQDVLVAGGYMRPDETVSAAGSPGEISSSSLGDKLS